MVHLVRTKPVKTYYALCVGCGKPINSFTSYHLEEDVKVYYHTQTSMRACFDESRTLMIDDKGFTMFARRK